MGFVYASFSGRKQAARAVSALASQSFDPDRIQVLTRHKGRVKRVPVYRQSFVPRGALIGGAAGITAGLAAGITLTDNGTPSFPWLFFAGGGLVLGLLCGIRATHLRGRFTPAFPGRCPKGQDIVVGVFANAKSARHARTALKSVAATRTYVAHSQPRLVSENENGRASQHFHASAGAAS